MTQIQRYQVPKQVDENVLLEQGLGKLSADVILSHLPGEFVDNIEINK